MAGEEGGEMRNFDLTRKERDYLAEEVEKGIKEDIKKKSSTTIRQFGSDSDIYIRRIVSRVLWWLYRDRPDLKPGVLAILEEHLNHPNAYIRQTMVSTIAEMGAVDPKTAFSLLELTLQDEDPIVKRGVIGALKRLGKKNPDMTVAFAKTYLQHPDPEVRREIVHGIELHGRTNPEDVLPLLEVLQDDPSLRVRQMVIHVLGQISYKRGCLERVAAALKKWQNRELVESALNEILDVHEKYEIFSAKSYYEAIQFLKREFPV
jgi:HEAT repeat protein